MDKQVQENVARIVTQRYSEAILHYWFSHDLGEITDQQFLEKKKQLFERAHETESLCGRVGSACVGAG